MGRKRPVQQSDMDRNGWELVPQHEEIPLLAPGNVAMLVFAFEDGEPGKAQVEELAVVVRSVEGARCTGVLQWPPQIEAAITLFSEVEFGPQHVASVLGPSSGDEQVRMLDRAVASKPHEQRLWCARGVQRQRFGELSAAISDFDACLKLGPMPDASAGRAFCHALLGDEDAARADFQQALKDARGNAPLELEINRALAMLDYAFSA